jgi:hypothetical protein
MGERSGQMIQLGQPIRVHIVAVNVPARQLNVAPVEPLGQGREPAEPKKRKKARAERKPHQVRKLDKLKKKRRK